MTNPPALIIGLPGSLRRGSYNAMLLRAAAELAPPSVRLEQASIRGIPLYDGDLEAEHGLPEPVRAPKEQLAASAAADVPRVFGDRPVALMSASPGRFGGVLAQDAWLPVLRALNVRLWFGPRVVVAGAAKVFDESGSLVDERARAAPGVHGWLRGLRDGHGALTPVAPVSARAAAAPRPASA